MNFMHIVKRQSPTSRATLRLPPTCVVGFAAGEKASCFAQTLAVWGWVRITPALLQPNWNSRRGAAKVCGKHDGREDSQVRSGVGLFPQCKGRLQG